MVTEFFFLPVLTTWFKRILRAVIFSKYSAQCLNYGNSNLRTYLDFSLQILSLKSDAKEIWLPMSQEPPYSGQKQQI